MSSHIEPLREPLAAISDLPPGEPIHMLNLIRFRDRARYPEGHEHADAGWSGRRAYQEYSRTSWPVFTRIGGVIVWRGSFTQLVIGPPDEHWDVGFVAQYPSGSAFAEMLADPEYRRATVNRTAAVLDSRLLRFAPPEAG